METPPPRSFGTRECHLNESTPAYKSERKKEAVKRRHSLSDNQQEHIFELVHKAPQKKSPERKFKIAKFCNLRKFLPRFKATKKVASDVDEDASPIILRFSPSPGASTLSTASELSQICDDDTGQESYTAKLFPEFSLDWSTSEPLLLKLIGKGHDYESPQHYAEHAKVMLERYKPPAKTPTIPDNLLRMVAFLLAVKVGEDFAVFNSDFLDAYVDDFPDDFDMSIEKLNKLEKQFLAGIDWNTSFTLPS